ncbi:type I-B CRISPR-associated endonuclease Cas1b [Candidatus Stoquefichus massiliensis]|uniref:type I-B CRISPR-associated endonuclease Cas1b n=1 Tax=Candidatus Stoquefichus massiliensis TaxID=1470350 RepID=UPI00048674B6|nr:type I-B CRISPR-associated endonuclease Cas1b [Candidatus Stoquefichus massiliensis]
MGSTKYITSMGELSRKDNSLCFRKNQKNVYLPIENIKEIYCMNEISINTKLLDYISSKNIMVHFFNYYGFYSGTFYPREQYNSGRLLVKEVEAYHSEKRIVIARKIVKAIAVNIDEVLYHYYKHNNKEVKNTIDWIRGDFKKLIYEQNDIQSIMLLEGELWQRFYSAFQFILPTDFMLNKRVRRPPDNPINALISFGNSLLYTKCISIIYQTHLNQTISYLHEPSESRFSLSLDLSETFKPVIVFKTIFDLVNNKKLRVKDHFEKKVNYCILNETGRQIFIQAFEERLDKTFVNKKLNRKMTYKTAVKMDCYKLIKYLLEDKDFEFFSLKEGQ